MHMNRHDGEIIELEIRKSEFGIAEIARRLNVDRRTLYYWFKKKSLNRELIYRIAAILQTDISDKFPNYFSDRKGGEQQEWTNVMDGAREDLYYWRAKYIELLERYSLLLESSLQVEPSDRINFS